MDEVKVEGISSSSNSSSSGGGGGGGDGSTPLLTNEPETQFFLTATFVPFLSFDHGFSQQRV